MSLDIDGDIPDRFWTRTNLIRLIFIWKWQRTCISKVTKVERMTKYEHKLRYSALLPFRNIFKHEHLLLFYLFFTFNNKTMSLHFKKKDKPSPSPSGSQSFEDDEYAKVIEGIKRIYKQKIKPVEVTYNFEGRQEINHGKTQSKTIFIGFHSAPLTDSDIEAKPIVLLIGQYSTVSDIQ